MSLNRKKPKADLRKNYKVFLEIGLIVVLALLIVAMKIELRGGDAKDYTQKKQEVVKMKEVVRTQQKKQPPPPPKPTVPVEVPNDKVLSDQNVNLDADFDLNEKLSKPKAPTNSGEGKEEKVFMAVQHMPELNNKKDFYGGVEYPRGCKMANIEGTVYVQFVVTGEGQVTNAKVVRGIGGGCDKYALQYVKENAQFSPGRQRGNPVSVQFTLPITFNLN